MGGVLKYEIQKWLEGFSFSHLITVEPTPFLPHKRDEVLQRFRIIEFFINKKYLRNSFTKWKNEDRFWFVGWKQGDEITKNRHYHLLLHSPDLIYKNTGVKYQLGMDVWWNWIQLPSTNPYTHKRRKMFYGNGNLPIKVNRIKSNTGAVRYSSRDMDYWSQDADDFFFTTPNRPTKNRTKVPSPNELSSC